MIDFALASDFDTICLSNTRKASDIEYVRQILEEAGASDVQIIAKIDSEEGLTKFEEILHFSDGVMICRADLAIEIPPERVFVAQKWMVEKANFAAKPALITQQLFTSMVKNARPTRGEASDVSAAISAGVDCLCLEEETTEGDYPVNAVQMLCKCIVESENTIDYKKEFNDVKLYCPTPDKNLESIALAAVQSIYDLGVGIILVHTTVGGQLAKLIARYKPEVAVISCSSNQFTVNQISYMRGITGFLCEEEMEIDQIFKKASKMAVSLKLVDVSDRKAKAACLYAEKIDTPQESFCMKILMIE